MASRRSLDVSSVLSNDDLSEYDFISDGHRSLESSVADLGINDVEPSTWKIHEPAPSDAAKQLFGTPGYSAEDIQLYVLRSLGGVLSVRPDKQVRVYVDGIFELFGVSCALQLRQAKLAFPSVHLLVGVFPDDACLQYGYPVEIPHVERCELLRHLRWVDEVVPNAPWKIEDSFLRTHRIDFVAIDEGSSVDPACDKERMKGFDYVKSIQKAIPLRRTAGVKSKGEVSTVASSRQGTVRGVPFELAQGGKSIPVSNTRIDVLSENAFTPSAETVEESPFEEPPLDEFGTGHGI